MIDARDENGTASRQMIAFFVGEQEFCLDEKNVREIRVWTPVSRPARSPTFICGVIDLRGHLLPVVDFAARLGLSATRPSRCHTILVIRIAEKMVGLLVDGVSEILTVKREHVQPRTPMPSGMAEDVIVGFVAGEGRMLGMISVDRIFADVEGWWSHLYQNSRGGEFLHAPTETYVSHNVVCMMRSKLAFVNRFERVAAQFSSRLADLIVHCKRKNSVPIQGS